MAAVKFLSSSSVMLCNAGDEAQGNDGLPFAFVGSLLSSCNFWAFLLLLQSPAVGETLSFTVATFKNVVCRRIHVCTNIQIWQKKNNNRNARKRSTIKMLLEICWLNGLEKKINCYICPFRQTFAVVNQCNTTVKFMKRKCLLTSCIFLQAVDSDQQWTWWIVW